MEVIDNNHQTHKIEFHIGKGGIQALIFPAPGYGGAFIIIPEKPNGETEDEVIAMVTAAGFIVLES